MAAANRGATRTPSGSEWGAFTRPAAGWAVLGVATIVYFQMRQTALSGSGNAGRLEPQQPDLLLSLANVVRAIGFYIAKVFVPTHLDAYIPIIPDPDVSLAVGVIGTLAAVGAGLYVWRRGDPLIAFLIAWFYGALAPSLSIAFFQISEAPVAERYLYLPSAGFCLLAGYLGFVKLPALWTPEKRRIALVLAGAAGLLVTVLYAGASVERAKVWRNDVDFWTDGVAKSPDEGLPHLHLGLAYANQEKDDLAEQEYIRALNANYDDEGRSIVYNNLGMLYMSKGGSLDKAEESFLQAIRIRPDYATPYYGMGLTSLRRAEEASRRGENSRARSLLEESRKHLDGALRYNPQYVKAHGLIGQVLSYLGRDADALPHLDRVLQLVSRGREFQAASELKAEIERRARGRAEAPKQ